MIIRNPATLGAAIRDRRRELGLEQRALAEKVGVGRRWIIDVEKGKPGSEIGLIFRTLRVLGIELATAPAAEADNSSGRIDLNAIVEATRKPRK